MIGSMTGYGRAEDTLHGRKILAEVKSVNNRYFDCGIKLPRGYIFAEEDLKKAVRETITRGKVDVFITIDDSALAQNSVRVNKPVADGYYAALTELRDAYNLDDDVSVSLLARFPDVFLVQKTEEDAAQTAGDIAAVLRRALAAFETMRETEGEKMRQDILQRADTIEALVTRIEGQSGKTLEEYRQRLYQKIKEVLEDRQMDEGRVLTEVALYADKIAVDEETVRLRSHLSQLREMFAAGGAIGRKLDFLIQECNRESNTIGSKCCDLEVSRCVVELKSEIEKIREQVQNIE